MISLGAPIALIAGGLLACGVVALHLLAPRPPDRAPLPTARFLRAEARTTLRFHRSPTDVPVMAARMFLALLLGLLFAQPRWLPERDTGVTRIVLLDRGAGMANVWDAALDAARRETAQGNTRVVTYAAGELPTTVATATDSSALMATRPVDHESSYLAALRALRVTLADVSTQEAEAVLITRPRWSAWDEQLAGLREAAWPGALRIVAVGADVPEAEGDVEGASAPPTSFSPIPQPANRRAAAALGALGYSFGDATDPGALRFIASGEDLNTALEYARAGDTVVVFGAGNDNAAPPEITTLWDADAWPDPPTPSHLRVASRVLTLGDVEFAPGRAAALGDSAALLPVVLDDGAPLAAARRTGAGCVVRFGAPVDAGSSDPAYPHLLRALADGCRSGSEPQLLAGTALDSSARTVLEGAGPARVAVANVGGALGSELSLSLTGWVLLLTVLAALFESWLVWQRGRRRAAGLQAGGGS